MGMQELTQQETAVSRCLSVTLCPTLCCLSESKWCETAWTLTRCGACLRDFSFFNAGLNSVVVWISFLICLNSAVIGSRNVSSAEWLPEKAAPPSTDNLSPTLCRRSSHLNKPAADRDDELWNMAKVSGRESRGSVCGWRQIRGDWKGEAERVKYRQHYALNRTFKCKKYHKIKSSIRQFEIHAAVLQNFTFTKQLCVTLRACCIILFNIKAMFTREQLYEKQKGLSFASSKYVHVYMNYQKCCSMHARPAVGGIGL